MGIGSSELSPKRFITTKEEVIKVCFLNGDTSKKEFLSAADIGYHPRVIKEKEMVSRAHVNAALTRTINDSFRDKIRVAGKEDQKWQERGRQLVRIRENETKMQDE